MDKYKYSTFEKTVLVIGSVLTLALPVSIVKNIVISSVVGNKLENVLDINRDGKLSAEEIKKFYDEIGISPYTAKNLRNVSDKDIGKFLDKY